MQKDILVLCDSVISGYSKSSNEHKVLQINQFPPQPNLRLKIDNISHKILKSLDKRCRDLLDIAAFVYHADGSVTRGTNKDVFNQDWSRKFKFIIPVREPEIWNKGKVKETLVEFLEFLMDDECDFEFIGRGSQAEQLVLSGFDKATADLQDAGSVLLFSGGMDALSGAIHLASIGKKPILISHQPNPVVASRQIRLANLLRERFPTWPFPHMDLTVNRIGNEAKEPTQRSRSFLFLAIGTLIAFELGLTELVVAENGITSFNFPRLSQTLGSQATKSTHPKTLSLFRNLVSQVLGITLDIKTPFIWDTRADEIDLLRKNNCIDLLPASVSCNHARRSKMQPHCGTCSQCIDRRFAVKYLGLDSSLDGELNGFEKDIFQDALADGEETLQTLSTITFSNEINEMGINDFIEKYVQIFDVIGYLPGDTEDNIYRIFNLFKRYAKQVVAVMGKEVQQNWQRISYEQLPRTSLLVRALSGDAKRMALDIASMAETLKSELLNCPPTKNKPFEDVCEKVLTFLFCEGTSPEMALINPEPQSENDQGYERRDLVFQNRATQGLWADIRRDYAAEGIIIDAKNYKDEIDSAPIREFSAYLKDKGLGRFGLLIGRKIPSDVRDHSSRSERISAAVYEQKSEWQNNNKMIILLDQEDLTAMMGLKLAGKAPTDLIYERIFTLKKRV